MKRLIAIATMAAMLAVPVMAEAKCPPKKVHKKPVACEPACRPACPPPCAAPCFNPLAPVAGVFQGTAMFIGSVGDGIAGIFSCGAR